MNPLVRTALMVCLLASATNVQAQQPGWSTTGLLGTGRVFHTATALANGKVLVVGGIGPNPYFSTGTAELYDPATGQWSATGSMSTPRNSHVGVRLTNGKVLVAEASAEQSTAAHRPARRSMIPTPAPGAPSGVSGLRAPITVQPCSPTAGCWSRAVPQIASSEEGLPSVRTKAQRIRRFGRIF